MNILVSLTGAMLLLSGAGSLEELGPDEYERYCSLADRPVCLNLASAARLRSCGLFSDYQVASLQHYIEESGDILSISELGTVPGFTPELADALAPAAALFIACERCHEWCPAGANRHGDEDGVCQVPSPQLPPASD